MICAEQGKIPATLAVVAALIGAPVARAEGWRSYHNTRFGVTADAPADWSIGPEPESNDGRIFTSPDGRAQLTISGMYSVGAPADERALRLAPLDGESVTYKTSNDRMIVVSGVKGRRIFYRKYLLSCGGAIWNDVSLEYPDAEKAKYDALVVHVAASLRPGPGYGVGRCK